MLSSGWLTSVDTELFPLVDQTCGKYCFISLKQPLPSNANCLSRALADALALFSKRPSDMQHKSEAKNKWRGREAAVYSEYPITGLDA